MRPQPWSPQELHTLWLDFGTGYGVTGAGEPVKARIGGRRQKPNLLDFLETAAHYNAERIMFVGKLPESEPGKTHWLLAKTDGWSGDQVHPRTPAATFTRKTTQQRVYVRTAAEWFGDVRLSPAQARECWDTVAVVLRGVEERATMFLAPSATGRNLWALSLPRNVDPQPVAPDIAEEIHRTSGQHHLEHLVAGAYASEHDDCVPLMDPAKTPRIDSFSYVDGRFMYAALCRELGIGPGRRLKRDSAFQLIENEPYARARVLIRFTVPEDWNHVGIFGVQHANPVDGWYYPNRPGATGETWADMSEIHVARSRGWLVDPQEAVVFDKARPLDTFAERMVRARERVMGNQDLHPTARKAVGAALRAIVLQAIGAFASRGPEHAVKVASAREIPAEYQATATRYGTEFVYTVPGALTERNRAWYHPELAAQVWARGRARVLDCPGADRMNGGALNVDPRTLIGINGDAIYTSSLPTWSLPVERGGADDGKTGRMRLQGFIPEPVALPDTLAKRDALRKKAESLGPNGAFEAEAVA